jgi:hypothetical protein
MAAHGERAQQSKPVRRVAALTPYAPIWQNVRMVGERMNNTAPGIRSTAGYILLQANVVGGKAATLVDQYKRDAGLTEGVKAA